MRKRSIQFLVVFGLIVSLFASISGPVSAQEATPLPVMCQSTGQPPDANGNCTSQVAASAADQAAATSSGTTNSATVYVCVGGAKDGQQVSDTSDCALENVVYVCPDGSTQTAVELCSGVSAPNQGPVVNGDVTIVANPAPQAPEQTVAPQPQAVTPQAPTVATLAAAPNVMTPQWTTCPTQGDVSQVVGVSMLPVGTERCTFTYGAPDIGPIEITAPVGALVTLTTHDNLTVVFRGDGQQYLINRVTMRVLGGDVCRQWAGEDYTGRMQQPPFMVYLALANGESCAGAANAGVSMAYNDFVSQYAASAHPPVSAPVAAPVAPVTADPVQAPTQASPAVVQADPQTQAVPQSASCTPQTATSLFASDPNLGNVANWQADPGGNPNKVVYGYPNAGPQASATVPAGYTMDYDGGTANAGGTASGLQLTLNCPA
jgi:hypothetical protein